jgi:nitrate reductase NapAB chaperone NapD
MVVASGFVEVDGMKNTGRIVGELKKRNMKIDYIETEKVIFLFERESFEDVRTEIDSLKNVEDVRNVHLTYYCFEGDGDEV